MKKISRWLIAAIAILVISGAIFYQSGIFTPARIVPGERPVPETAAAKGDVLRKREIPVIYRTVGTVRSRNEIELSPRITARVLEITKRSGDSVKKDEVLVRLDDSDLLAARNRALEQLNSAEASQELAQRDYRRQERLLKQNVISQKSFDEAEERLKEYSANVKAARQSLKVAEANLSYATIRSPMNAVVSERYDDPGDLATPGNVIMKIFDPELLMLYVPLSESLIGAVKVGDRIKFEVEALKKNFSGEVREIVPSVDPGSRTFMIKMCIIDKHTRLMPGMFGTIELKLGTENAYIVPESAVEHIGQLEYLKIADSNGRTMKILVRTVNGPEPGTVKIVSGLDGLPGDVRIVK